MKNNLASQRPKSALLDRGAVGIVTVAFLAWIGFLAAVPMTDAPFRENSLFLGCNVAMSAISTWAIANLAGTALLRSVPGALAFCALFLTVAGGATYLFDVYAACGLDRGLCL